QHQPRGAAGQRRCLEVAQRIAHGRNGLQIDVEAACDVLEQARLGLAAVATVVGPVWAHEYGVHDAACLGDFAPQLGMDGIERFHREQPASDTRLIAGNDDAPVRARQARNGLEAARYGDPFIGRLDEGVAVVIDDAVAIEYDELHCASLEMSATWFMT